MRKIDGNDLVTWILQMEHYFNLRDVKHTQKVHIASIYLEPNQFVWYRWLCSCKPLVSWAIFMEEMIAWLIFTEEMMAHYEDTKINLPSSN